MPRPPDVVPGQFITAEHINAVKTSVYDWQGDMNGNGFSVNNASGIGSNFIELINASMPFLDFKDLVTDDFDCRIQQVSNGLMFHTGGNGATAERMRITATGSMGIGTDAPASKLDVAGNLRLSGARSTLFFRGDNTSTQLAGLQILPIMPGDMIVTTTDNAGNPMNGLIRLGGFGNYNSNTVDLAVSGVVRTGQIGTTTPEHLVIVQNNEPRMIFYESAGDDIRIWLGGSLKLLSVDGSGFVKAT